MIGELGGSIKLTACRCTDPELYRPRISEPCPRGVVLGVVPGIETRLVRNPLVVVDAFRGSLRHCTGRARALGITFLDQAPRMSKSSDRRRRISQTHLLSDSERYCGGGELGGQHAFRKIHTPALANRQKLHASPILRVLPIPLFLIGSKTHSSIPMFVHLSQRRGPGTHF